MKKIVVVGSINMDLVTICKRNPEAGETIFGEEFFQIPGGKGANQATTLGKLNSEVIMLGKVGDDFLGEELIKSLQKNNVNTNFVEKEKNVSSGIAKIIVEKKTGQNRIIVVPGANFKVDRAYIDKHLAVIKNADYILAQLEIPQDTVEYLFEKVKEFNKITVLNPAPASFLNEKIIKNTDYLIPNETELEILSEIKIINENSFYEASEKLFKLGIKNLLVTLGSKGSIFINKKEKIFVPAFKVKVVDTTAAGDSFIGGFINGLANDLSLEDSMKRGTKVAAISVTRVGAQSSLPTFEEVINFKGDN